MATTRTNDYEVAYLVDAQISPEELTSLKDRIIEVAKTNGAVLGEPSQWDRRRMAYSIKGKREGIYVFLPMKASAAAIDEITRSLKLAEPVLRHLVVRTDED
jgi:small subunit ribosomal protein S6